MNIITILFCRKTSWFIFKFQLSPWFRVWLFPSLLYVFAFAGRGWGTVCGWSGVGAWKMGCGLFCFESIFHITLLQTKLSQVGSRKESLRSRRLSLRTEHEMGPRWPGSGPTWFLLMLLASANVLIFTNISHYLILPHFSFIFCDTKFATFSCFLILINLCFPCLSPTSFLYF